MAPILACSVPPKSIAFTCKDGYIYLDITDDAHLTCHTLKHRLEGILSILFPDFVCGYSVNDYSYLKVKLSESDTITHIPLFCHCII